MDVEVVARWVKVYVEVILRVVQHQSNHTHKREKHHVYCICVYKRASHREPTASLTAQVIWQGGRLEHYCDAAATAAATPARDVD